VLRRHTDITDRAGGTADGRVVRFHVPVITDPAVTLTSWDLDGSNRTRHLAAWRPWYLDVRKPHAVTNASRATRVHLVIDLVSNARIRELICTGRAA
jgi:hypothetical protein